MRFLQRLEVVLRATLVMLSLGLVSAIVLGILLRPPAPVGYAAVAGQPLLRWSGLGPMRAGSPVRSRQHAIGIGVRCSGTGRIRVELHPFGAVDSPCSAADASNGGYVLSNTATDSTTLQVKTAADNRWSLVLTQPAWDGGTWAP